MDSPRRWIDQLNRRSIKSLGRDADTGFHVVALRSKKAAVIEGRGRMVETAATGAGVPKIDFVLGGARSGKTRLALARAEASGCAPVYVATATAGDAEMAARVAAHQAERGPIWSTVEEPLELTEALARRAAPGRILLVDCLTLWLSNLMFAERDIEAETARLTMGLSRLAGPVILVSNEVGLGIVPDNALARTFRDDQGRLNQAVAALADRVTFVAAGLPLLLKG